MSRSRALRIGALVGGVYLAVLLATSMVTTHRVRPLFEGVGPAAPYRWVTPPKEFAAGNQAPTPLDTTVALGPAISVNTADAQAILNLGAGAVAPHETDTTIRVRIDPLDPATLGPVPAPLRADGNAYRVTLGYAPSGAAIDQLTTAGNIALQVPEPAQVILFSADGRDWQRLDSHTAGQPTLEAAAFARPGLYVAATSAPAPSSGGGGSSWPAYAVFVLTVGLAAALAIGTQVRRRRRRPARRPAGRGRR